MNCALWPVMFSIAFKRGRWTSQSLACSLWYAQRPEYALVQRFGCRQEALDFSPGKLFGRFGSGHLAISV
ncbi:hypothetical protein X767_16070 [Mesorhizobium sp. LSJC264A00]|nr:hypothetical protein X767_16070 [Mesorhizobium sp. LSJC264A00]